MINEGDLVFLDYGEVPQVVHSRLVAGHVQNDVYVIVTPDYDIYEEQLSNLNPDVVGYFYGGPGLGARPPIGVNPARVYGFRAMTAIEYQRLMQQGRTYANGLRTALGIPVIGAAAAPVAAAPAAAVPAAPTVWVALESRGAIKRGSVVFGDGQALPPGAVQLGDRAIIPDDAGNSICLKRILQTQVGSMESKDLRILDPVFDSQGSRRMEFADAVAKMSQDAMPGGGLQLDGPSSCLGVLKSMVARGLTPVTDHERWVRTCEISKGDRSVYEMEVITRVMEAFIMIDQVNVPNLVGTELLMRRWQVIREAHRISPGAPDYSAADIVMGWSYRRGDGMHQPLARYVAEELKDQAAIAKEARKAKEEMTARAKSRPNPKGGGAGATGA